jgi:SPP1 gp7 family putative phage head morphogenesis protein
MITLKPIIEKKYYSDKIEEVIMDFLTEHFYLPIYKVIEPIEEYYNSNEDIIVTALRKSEIQYINGKFSGNFSKEISQALRDLGAKYNKVTKTYDIKRQFLSMSILDAIGYASMFATIRANMIIDALNHLSIENNFPQLQKLLEVPLDATISDLSEQAYNTMKEAITIVPELSEEVKVELKKAYFDDVRLSITNFTTNQTTKLREMVQENLFTGLPDNKILVEEIVREFQVSENKARFLARNETENLVAAYSLAQFKEVGITKYIWDATMDSRTRKIHKDLNGKIIEIDNPPIVNEQGDRKHAGFDFNCRCLQRGIIDESVVTTLQNRTK